MHWGWSESEFLEVGEGVAVGVLSGKTGIWREAAGPGVVRGGTADGGDVEHKVCAAILRSECGRPA